MLRVLLAVGIVLLLGGCHIPRYARLYSVAVNEIPMPSGAEREDLSIQTIVVGNNIPAAVVWVRTELEADALLTFYRHSLTNNDWVEDSPRPQPTFSGPGFETKSYSFRRDRSWAVGKWKIVEWHERMELDFVRGRVDDPERMHLRIVLEQRDSPWDRGSRAIGDGLLHACGETCNVYWNIGLYFVTCLVF